MPVCAAIAQQGFRLPQKVALRYGKTEVTYGELELRVGAATALLKECGVRPGSRVGLGLFDTPDHVIGLLALGRLGATAVPIDYRSSVDHKRALFEAFNVVLTLTSRASKSPLGQELIFDTTNLNGATPNLEPQDPNATYLINFSSGSTGLPKPVFMSQQQLFHRCMAWWTDIGITPDLVYLSVLPLAYSFGRNYLLYSLMAGHTVVMHDPLFREEELVQFTNDQDITLAMFPATIHRRLLAFAQKDELLLPNLRVLISGAAPLHPHEKIEVVNKINPNFYEIYGHNGAGLISVLQPDEVRQHAATVGVTSFLSEVQVVDDEDRELPAGEVGRIRSRGAQVAPDQENTDGDTPWPWCYTGEIGSFDNHGRLVLRDRADDMIVTGGFNVFPLEVEQALLEHPGVIDAAVVGIPSQRDGQDVAAFVVLGNDGDVREMRSFCRGRLASYKVPSRFFNVDVLPRSAASKVLRRELVEHAANYREMCINET